MIIDWLLYGLFVFLFAQLLNKTVLKNEPASTTLAFGLAIGLFFINIALWSFIRYQQQDMISKVLYGFHWENQLHGIFRNAFIFSLLFFVLLNRGQRAENNQTFCLNDPAHPIKSGNGNKEKLLYFISLCLFFALGAGIGYILFHLSQ